MSKKRCFGIMTAIAIMLGSLCCPALAAENGVKFSIADLQTDKVKLEITNDKMKDQQVVLYVFHTGKSSADLKADGSSAKEALLYTKAFRFTDETMPFEFYVNVQNAENSVYQYLFTSGNGERISGSFEFYSKAAKEALVQEINDAKTSGKTPQELAERVRKYFEINFDLYNAVTDKNKVGDLLIAVSKEFEVTFGNVQSVFETAVVIAAFNEGRNALVKDGKFAYMDYVVIRDLYMTYYSSKLNAKGIKSVLENNFKKNYKTIDEVRNGMEREVVVNAVNENVLSGYGYIETVLFDFKEDFTAAGLNYEKYNMSDKDAVALAYNQQKKTTIEEIATAINSIVNNPPTPGTGGGGKKSSSPGTGSSAGQVTATPPASVTETEETTQLQEATFNDLAGFEWAKESIETLFRKGIISGREAGQFAPSDSITREEFTVLLVKAFELKNDAAKLNFVDVSSSRWSYSYIASAFEAGIVSGDGRNFNPSDNITRQDIAAILLRTLMKKNLMADIKPAVGIFDDEAEISPYALESVQIMNELGIVNGDGTGNFRPKNNANRAESAVIIQRAMELL